MPRETYMDRIMIFSIAAALAFGGSATAQAPAGQQKSLSATLDVYVFPAEGQGGEQQSKDEAECYQWATGNSGVDPFELSKQTAAQQEQAVQKETAVKQDTRGAGARGAVRGAAAGALIGEIASDDAGEGAAYGAAAGAIMARRRAKSAQQQAGQQTQQQVAQIQAASSEQLANFKKAFSVCLEAKRYLVKY
jgi:hypothetical protein